jgi:hypothetical protein
MFELGDAVREWADNDTIHRVVFILAGEGSESGLFTLDGWLDPNLMESMVGSCAGKPVLGILDFCNSAIFADEFFEIVRRGRENPPAVFLSSGRGPSYKTAVVLSDDPQAPNARFAVYSTMFHRSLLLLVARDPGNPGLDELPRLLNEDSAGGRCFYSVIICAQTTADGAHLRDFFGPSLDPMSPIFGRSDGADAILPLEPPGGFDDDLRLCLPEGLPEGSGEKQRHLGRRFVRIDVSDGQVGVIDRGELEADCDIIRRMKYGPSMKPKLDTELRVDSLVKRLLRKAGVLDEDSDDGRSEWTANEEDKATFRRVVRFVRRESYLHDERPLYPLRPYLNLLSWRKWCDHITDIRRSPWLIVPRRGVRGVRRSKPYP